MRTVYRTYVEGRLLYTGDSLEKAITAWDRETYTMGRVTAGGVSVATYDDLLQVRDGWILHVREDGTVYLHPRVLQEA